MRKLHAFLFFVLLSLVANVVAPAVAEDPRIAPQNIEVSFAKYPGYRYFHGYAWPFTLKITNRSLEPFTIYTAASELTGVTMSVDVDVARQWGITPIRHDAEMTGGQMKPVLLQAGESWTHVVFFNRYMSSSTISPGDLLIQWEYEAPGSVSIPKCAGKLLVSIQEDIKAEAEQMLARAHGNFQRLAENKGSHKDLMEHLYILIYSTAPASNKYLQTIRHAPYRYMAIDALGKRKLTDRDFEFLHLTLSDEDSNAVNAALGVYALQGRVIPHDTLQQLLENKDERVQRDVLGYIVAMARQLQLPRLSEMARTGEGKKGAIFSEALKALLLSEPMQSQPSDKEPKKDGKNDF